MPPKKKQKQAAPPTLTQPKLLAAASHVLANHYSKPYEVPATAKEDEDYWYMDFHAVHGIERPNHRWSR